METILTLRNSSGWSLLASAVIGHKATFEALYTAVDEELWQDQVRWRLFLSTSSTVGRLIFHNAEILAFFEVYPASAGHHVLLDGVFSSTCTCLIHMDHFQAIALSTALTAQNSPPTDFRLSLAKLLFLTNPNLFGIFRFPDVTWSNCAVVFPYFNAILPHKRIFCSTPILFV